MIERYVSTSKVAFGRPPTFGWLRWPALDKDGMEAWERPDGAKVRIPRGTQLARIRGAKGPPILVRHGPRE